MSTKIALVTGDSSGIGEATALALAEAGYRVYTGAHRVERMEHLKEHGIRPLTMDVTDDESLQSAVSQILAEEGRIDVLVNNAGYGSYGALEDVPLSEARSQVEVNVFGATRLTQFVLPHMREQRSGTIVNITSMGGKIYTPLGSWYHATKFALETISDCLRMELKPFGINVVVIEPGGIQTEWGGSRRSCPVTNATRRELPHYYLSRSSTSLVEIAYLLGFQDGNSFIRAFRGWTGQTPGSTARAT